MSSNLSITEQLLYSTIRIECKDLQGNTSTGTGFFFKFLVNKDDNSSIPVIITNKHVVENSINGTLIFTERDNEDNPIDSSHLQIDVPNFIQHWLFHPNPEVDLCAMPIAGILQQLESDNKSPFFITIDKTLIPSKEELQELNALEDIVMIGYPNGIWDFINNQPILRKGITATHPNKDYCGKKEFMVDIACFPGSSGSPILILNETGYHKKHQGAVFGSPRILFLGVLYAGPQHTATGSIEIQNVPTRQIPVPISRIPNNLGLVIKAERIIELENLFKN